MFRFQPPQPEDAQDLMTTLIGSAIELLCGEAGVFVVSNEAFDPQSSSEYIVYRINEAMVTSLLAHVQEGMQPTSAHPFLLETLTPDIISRLNIASEVVEQSGLEYGSLAVYDQKGPLGSLYFLRAANARSCLEQAIEDTQQSNVFYQDDRKGKRSALYSFIAQLAAGLRFAFRSQSLFKEQERLAAIFQNSMDGILTVDKALRIIDFNPTMEQLTGWHKHEVLGRFYFKVLCPQDRFGNDLGLEDSVILQVFAGQQITNREMIICARDGQRFTVAITASCVRSMLGEPIAGILNIRDLTRERQQEEQRSTFTSVISHELKTPISIIKGYASTLARKDAQFDTQVLQSRLLAIEEEADRLDKLVGNLLYASRIQANGLQMEITSLDLEHLIESVLRRLKAKAPDVSISLSIPEHLPIVMADRDRIEEVLQNLLDNAIKYSPRHPEISIFCFSTGEEAIVSVKDSGMGISVREQEQVFERFQRVGDSHSRSTPGAGLGLYIARAIIEAHGGRIWVESTWREGSTFSFSLPREEKAQLPMVVF
jgi:PAS domain S-box-containing protein